MEAFADLLLSAAEAGVVRTGTGSGFDPLEMVESLPAGAWLRLDQATRLAIWRTAPGWAARAGAAVSRGQAHGIVLGLASCHPNGRVREAALRRIVASASERRLTPFVVIRTADWVPQVRDVAIAGLGRLLAEGDPAVLRSALPVALQFQRRERARDAVAAVLQAVSALPEAGLLTLLDHPDVLARREVLRHVLDRGLLGFEQLLHLAAHDPDLFVRRAATDAAAGSATGGSLAPLLRSRSASVRLAALQAEAHAGRGEAAALSLLADPSAPVRTYAQAQARCYGHDVAGFYRQRLHAGLVSPGSVSPGSVSGLAETGSAADAPLLAAYLDADRPRVRAHATAGLQLLGCLPTRTAWGLLTDPAPCVVRQAARALTARTLPRGELMALLAPDHRPHTRLAALRLLRSSGTADRIIADLTVTAGPDPALARRGRDDLMAWLDRDAPTAYDPLTPVDKLSAAALVEASTSVLTPTTVRLLRFHLDLR